MDWLIMIIWGVVLPLPVKAGTEYILRQYYQYPQRLSGCRVYLHCLLSGIFIVFWSDGQGVSVLFLTLLFLCLVMLFHIDNAVFYLPDKLVFPVLWAGLLFQNEVQLVTISSALYGVIGGFFLLWFVAEGYAWCRKKSGLGRRGYQTVFSNGCLGGSGTARTAADAGMCIRAGGVRASLFPSPL
ncbi:prepilin peptidase [Morganella sp. Je.2.23]